MKKKKFKSIRTRLITNTMLIISFIFILVMSVITVMNIRNANHNIEKSEDYIRNALIAKGRTLANNNAIAMSGLAEDNAFMAVQALVSSTVQDDTDIEYGIYMDDSRIAWVNASSKNPSGRVLSPDPLTDPLSQWAATIIELSYQTAAYGNEKMIEFAAPVLVDDEILGHIRYGFSTRSMNKALKESYEDGIKTRNETIGILLILCAFSLLLTYIIIRHLASAITHPIGVLVESAATISEGNYNIEIKPESNDEIGRLSEAFETMRLKIKQFTNHLQELVDEKMQQVNDILNNIDQGLFTINLDGRVNKEYSARANDILKVQDVASSSLKELFRMDIKQERALNIWLDLVKKRHSKLRWKKLARLAPVHELEIASSDDIPDYISIQYQKVYNKEGRLSKIMVLAMDETEKRVKELQMESQRRKHENEMNIILGLVNTPPAEISEFMEDTCGRMKRIWQWIEDHLSEIRKYQDEYIISEDHINALYRDIHTIKGNSGSYGFEMLSGNAHEAENILEKLREPSETGKDFILKQVMECLDYMNDDIDEIQKKIKLIFGKSEDAAVRIPKSNIAGILERCSLIDRDAQSSEVQELIDRCISLSFVPLETVTRKYQKIVSRVARRSRKNIKFVIKPEHAFYPPDILSDIDDALVHMVRNAADHGIEQPETREELEKGIGQISFEFIEKDNTRTIILSDDGRGVDTEKLMEVCIKAGLISRDKAENLSEKEKLEYIFLPRISTSEKVTDVSGRGIGMDVVKRRVKKLGGTLSIDSITGKGTTISMILPSYMKESDMLLNSEPYSVLEELKENLAQAAADCVLSLLGKEVEMREPWRVIDRPDGNYDHVLFIESENREFRGITVLGIQTDSITEFTDMEADEMDMAVDALGELANIYTAMIMDEPKFRDCFGILKAFPPCYEKNKTSFPRMWGISGRLFSENQWINVGFAIRYRAL